MWSLKNQLYIKSYRVNSERQFIIYLG